MAHDQAGQLQVFWKAPQCHLCLSRPRESCCSRCQSLTSQLVSAFRGIVRWHYNRNSLSTDHGLELKIGIPALIVSPLIDMDLKIEPEDLVSFSDSGRLHSAERAGEVLRQEVSTESEFA